MIERYRPQSPDADDDMPTPDTAASLRPPTNAYGLQKYDAACKALAEAHRIDEVKDIRDKAIAMQAYAHQAKDMTLITKATEIRLRAERKAGEMLIEMAERKEREPKGGDRKSKSHGATLIPKLSDFGINKTQSSRWQRIAQIAPERFEEKVANEAKRVHTKLVASLLREDEAQRRKEARKSIIEHGCTVDDLNALVATGKRFAVILVDAPWPFVNWSSNPISSPDLHYETADIDAIKALPVAALAADDAALLLWGTWPQLPAVLDVIRAWGFEYKTCGFVWISKRRAATACTRGWATGRARTANTVCWQPKVRPSAWGSMSTRS